MRKLVIVVVVAVVALAGCPKKQVTLYRSLTDEAHATCDANKPFRVETLGKDPEEATEKGEAEIRKVIAQHDGCGAFVMRAGTGKTLDGPHRYVADFQWCKCR